MTLITGASGFLGQHLVRHLSAQGQQARALYHSHPPSDELKMLPGIAWLQCDLLDVYAVEEAMQGIKDVYHCAAIVTFDPGKKEAMLHFNKESTVNVVNQAIVQGIRKLVHVSSIAALGRTGDPKKEMDEEAEWEDSKHNSAYAFSKYLSEMEVWRGMGEGLNAAIVNPGIILGATSGHDLSASLMNMVYRGFPFYSNGVTSWVAANDVVKAMVLLMHSETEAERFIVSGGNFSYKEVLMQMATALHKKPPRFAANAVMTGIGWRVSALLRKVFGVNTLVTKETARNANSFSFYNNRKLVRTFPGFSYTPLQAAIEVMARSFEDYHVRK
jgi:nucleoside-diphosphate-sugar epimerase